MPSLAPHLALSLIAGTLLLAVPAAEGVRRLAARRWSAEAGRAPVLILGLAMSASAGVVAPDLFTLAMSLVLGWMLIALCIVDVRILRLPDSLTLPLVALGLAVAAVSDRGRLADHAIGAAAGYAVLAGVALAYRRLQHREGLGLGDAKLLAAAGAWLGWRPLPAVLLIASLGGLAWVAIKSMRGRGAPIHAPLAFGPALALALWLCWIWRQAVA